MQYIFLPTNKYIIPWSTITAILYIISFYNDCVTLSIGLYTLLIPWRKTMQSIMSLVMIFDSILYFITAYRQESNQSLEKKKANKKADKLGQLEKASAHERLRHTIKKKDDSQSRQLEFAMSKARINTLGRKRIEKLNHTLYETRFTKIAARYFKTYFFFDLLGAAPTFLYECTFFWTTDYDTVLKHHIKSPIYNFFFWLKLFKFMAVSTRINDTFNLLFNIIKDRYY